jgi:predicted MFS family arabinose efflux permease
MVARSVTSNWRAARLWAFVLVLVPASLAFAMRAGADRATALMIGLAVFAVVFAINSAVHSYLVLAYTDKDRVALDVGFYYMANAGGRLLGTLASGVVFQIYGLIGCLWGAAALVLTAAILSLGLPKGNAVVLATAGARESE